MSTNPVVWFEIYVQDLERAKAFYESVFQTKLERLVSQEVEIWGFPMEMNWPGAGGALVKKSGMGSGGNSTLVYFSCGDCAVEAARAAQYGGQIHREKTSIGKYGRIAYVMDTEGNMIGLHSME